MKTLSSPKKSKKLEAAKNLIDKAILDEETYINNINTDMRTTTDEEKTQITNVHKEILNKYRLLQKDINIALS